MTGEHQVSSLALLKAEALPSSGSIRRQMKMRLAEDGRRLASSLPGR